METKHECECGSRIVVLVTVEPDNARSYQAWVCKRCDRERSPYAARSRAMTARTGR